MSYSALSMRHACIPGFRSPCDRTGRSSLPMRVCMPIGQQHQMTGVQSGRTSLTPGLPTGHTSRMLHCGQKQFVTCARGCFDPDACRCRRQLRCVTIDVARASSLPLLTTAGGRACVLAPTHLVERTTASLSARRSHARSHAKEGTVGDRIQTRATTAGRARQGNSRKS